jgi:cytoskeletal protein CcmA (bactofilin family)
VQEVFFQGSDGTPPAPITNLLDSDQNRHRLLAATTSLAAVRRGNISCEGGHVLTFERGGFAMQQRAGVGSTVVIKGELTAQEDLVIAGRVEGTISVTGHLVLVEAGAHVVGDITATGIVVSGTVHGSLLAEERIKAEAGADLQGDVSAPRIAVADGAVVNGRIETVTASAKRTLKAAS